MDETKRLYFKTAASKHKNLMKVRPSIKYNKLIDHLKIVFHDARAKGQVVDFNWIWSKASKLNRELGKEDEIKKHVVATFIKRNKIKYRRIQRNKIQEKEHNPRNGVISSQVSDTILINHHCHFHMSLGRHMSLLKQTKKYG